LKLSVVDFSPMLCRNCRELETVHNC